MRHPSPKSTRRRTGHGKQHAARAHGVAKDVEKLGRAVSQNKLFSAQPVMIRQRFLESAPFRIRVMNDLGNSRRDSLPHRLRQTQRIDVGAEIQPAARGGIRSIDVPAMKEPLHPIIPFC